MANFGFDGVRLLRASGDEVPRRERQVAALRRQRRPVFPSGSKAWCGCPTASRWSPKEQVHDPRRYAGTSHRVSYRLLIVPALRSKKTVQLKRFLQATTKPLFEIKNKSQRTHRAQPAKELR